MITTYKLKLFASIFNNFNDADFYIRTTFDENDLQELKFNELKKGMVVALVTYEDGKFFCADGKIIKDIKGDKVYLANGQWFEANGAIAHSE